MQETGQSTETTAGAVATGDGEIVIGLEGGAVGDKESVGLEGGAGVDLPEAHSLASA